MHKQYNYPNSYSKRRHDRHSVDAVSSRKIILRPFFVVACVLVIGSILQALVRSISPNDVVAKQSAALKGDLTKETRVAFPVLDTSTLTQTQKNLLSVARKEYVHGATTGDDYAKKYSEGFNEPWCANFISWIRNEAGAPFVHKNTGYWRIPGVATLRDYFASSNAYHFVDGYTPKPGDVAFYYGITPDGNNNEHVAMVLGIRNDTLITIGGNEGEKGEMKIRYDKLSLGSKGLVGFGELKQ